MDTRSRTGCTTRELTEAEQDEIERELELVGLGRGRGKEAVSAEMSVKTDEATSWKEVFFEDWTTSEEMRQLAAKGRSEVTDKGYAPASQSVLSSSGS
jgi:hypothetical protein